MSDQFTEALDQTEETQETYANQLGIKPEKIPFTAETLPDAGIIGCARIKICLMKLRATSSIEQATSRSSMNGELGNLTSVISCTMLFQRALGARSFESLAYAKSSPSQPVVFLYASS